MSAKQLFFKTMPFVGAKFVLAFGTAVVSVLIFALLMAVGLLFDEMGLVITFCLGLVAVGLVRTVVMHWLGYLLKVGHVAVIAEACEKGVIPDNQISFGIAAVKSRFATSNVYFVVDKLVTGAVKQIQKGIGKVGEALNFIPGMSAITGFAQAFTNVALGYIDECCLAWTFRNKEQSAYKSAADGVALYAQNWKTLMAGAAKTVLKVILLVIVVLLAVFIPVGGLFKVLGWNSFIAFLIACFVAWIIKFAFMDSYIMIQMMSRYLDVAPKTTLTFDLYSKLCKISSKFKELVNKAEEAGDDVSDAPDAEPTVTRPGASSTADTDVTVDINRANEPAAESGADLICDSCHCVNRTGSRFCTNCGSPL